MLRNYSSPYNNNNGSSSYPACDEFDTRDNLTARRRSDEARNNNLDVMQSEQFQRRITKVMNGMSIAFFVLLICGVALTTVITLIAKSDDSESSSTTIIPKITTTDIENPTEITSNGSAATKIISTASATSVEIELTTSKGE